MTLSLTALVFIGAASVAALILFTAYRVLQEKVDSQQGSEDVALSPLRRFISPEKFLVLEFTLCLAGIVCGVMFLVLNDVTDPLLLLAVGAFMGVVGWKLPGIWFALKIRKRKELFDGQILHLTMTLANGLRSGQALPQSLAAAAERMPPPMQEELVLVLNETRLGLDLPEALERLYKRMPSEDLNLLLTSVRLTLKAGGSLADVLERMVGMIRSRTEFQQKLKAMTAQGRFQAIAMSLAPLVVYILLRLIDPPLMKPLTSTFIGWCAIGAVVLMLSIGFFFINKIVTIEV